jgi:hypothetical protein
MTEQNVTQNTDSNTPPVTVQDTSWQQFAPNYASPAEVAKALAETKASLTRTQQELAQFKNKPQETPKAEIPSWEFWDQPDKLYSLEQKKLTDEFRGTLEARGIHKPFIDDLEQTVFTAQQTQSKFDTLAGFPAASESGQRSLL